MFLSKIILFIVAATLIYSIYYTYPRGVVQSASQQKKHLTPHKKNIVILWDLHQVIFQRSIVHWAYLFITNAKLFSIIRHLDLPTLKIMGQLVLRKLKLYPHEITSEEFIAVARAAHNTALIDLVVLISCDYYPDQKIVELIQNLHTLGYTQHVGSNIGTTVFATFYKKYPHIFSLFSHYHIVHSDQLPVAKKPNRLFFTQYLENKKREPQEVIFIDDRRANIVTAQQTGIIGILFKDASQLESDLKELGII